LADRVFAPHYAAPLAMVAVDTASVRLAAAPDAERIASLQPGDVFETLDLSGGRAWGIVQASGLVGYVDRTALAPITAKPRT
jgi:hypothetical protein